MKVKLFLIFLLQALTVSGTLSAEARSECSESIPVIYQRVSPSVVFVSAIEINPSKLNTQVSTNIGSGFIIEKNGIILTNSHLVFNRRAISVTLDDGSLVPAEVIGVDPILDIALLRIQVPPEGLPLAKLGDSNKIRVGEEIITIGNPYGLEQTLTRGVVSGVNRILSVSPMSLPLPLLQIDAAVNPGNSGGPILNRCGEVMGIISLTLGEAENIAFAVPIHLIKEVLPQLKKEGRVIRPWIGVNGKLIGRELQDILNIPVVDGFLVETIESGSPAETAGINGGFLPVSIGGMDFFFGGDIITAINGQTVYDLEKFEKIIRKLKVGDTIHLMLYSEGKKRNVELTLIERPVLPGDLSSDDRILLPALNTRKKH